MKKVCCPLIILVSFLFSCQDKSTSGKTISSNEVGQKSDSAKKECCRKPERSMTSEITCPACGFKKTETLPTEVCQLVYKCTSCGNEMKPKEGDCCVFCSYGDHKCPSKQ